MDAAEVVTLAFRAVLRREPDVSGLATYTAALEGGQDLPWLLNVLTASDEFHTLTQRPVTRPFLLDSAPPMAVESRCGLAEQQALWDALAATWSELGQLEPHWSVLTEERYRQAKLDASALLAFRESGEEEVRRLFAWLRRTGWSVPSNAHCAEYGCGIGRVTQVLARQFGQLTAFDVSAPHLEQARAQIAAGKLSNVAFVQVRGPEELQRLVGIDLFYSVISLQHSPPPIIRAVLTQAFAALRPGGCAFFQVPTYGMDYSFDPTTWRPTGKMELHALPQHIVLALAYEAGLAVAEVQPDWCVGRPGEWISSTFLLIKPPASALLGHVGHA